ncbi:GW dipeptide domain-containing protein [Sunxiuqinia sp. sy24]|uniref:GW dipeptide domain-containing protein n=1 Tax=Sunxiuqinia sp. sy24 TaxID=3461495 RepID=UPI004046098D
MRLFIVLLMSSLLMGSCVQKKKESVQPLDTSLLMHQVEVKEVIQTDSYTYLKVSENREEFWIAVSRQEAKVGEKYYYASALEMEDFESKALGRVFDSIFFVQKISKEPIQRANAMAGKQTPQGKAIESFNSDIKLEPVKGGVTIEKLYASKGEYEGKRVSVKGKVVKVNKNIMSRNWIHIQDGTKHGEDYDLTITSGQLPEVGDVVTIEGVVTLNKDFGAGYFYELIMEEGQLVE